jgi:hypothetical protein
MPKAVAIVAQAGLYALFAGTIGWFSFNPRYQHLQDDQALLKLSFSHPGELREECRRRSPEELASLPPNMRQALDCPRERSPVTVELALNGDIMARRVVPPAGVARDGPSTLYVRFVVPAGDHHVAIRINDSVREPGFRHVREEKVHLAPGRILVVDFDPGKGGILLR